MFTCRFFLIVTLVVSQIAFANDLSNFGGMAVLNAHVPKADSSEKTILLTVAVSDVDYPPYNFEENGIYQGFAIDILRHIEQHSKYRFRFVKLPWPRVLKDVESGKFDMIPTFFKTESRDKQYAFIEPNYGFEVNQLFSLVENNISYSGKLEDLSQYTIGTVREYSYGQTFDNAEMLSLKPEIDEEALVRLLLGNRTEIIIGNPMTFYDLLDQLNARDKVEALTPIVERTPVYFALTRNRADHKIIQQQFKLVIEELLQSSKYQKLLDKYQFLPEYRM